MEATPPCSSQMSWTSRWRDGGASFIAKMGDPGTSPWTCLKELRTSSSPRTCAGTPLLSPECVRPVYCIKHVTLHLLKHMFRGAPLAPSAVCVSCSLPLKALIAPDAASAVTHLLPCCHPSSSRVHRIWHVMARGTLSPQHVQLGVRNWRSRTLVHEEQGDPPSGCPCRRLPRRP